MNRAGKAEAVFLLRTIFDCCIAVAERARLRAPLNAESMYGAQERVRMIRSDTSKDHSKCDDKGNCHAMTKAIVEAMATKVAMAKAMKATTAGMRARMRTGRVAISSVGLRVVVKNSSCARVRSIALKT